MVRCFIAVDLDSRVITTISQAIAELKEAVPFIRWIPPNNFHLTIKFLGKIEQERIHSIATALSQQLEPFPRFSINAKGLGVFPDLRRPKILWVGFISERLSVLVKQVELVLQPLGFAPENRPFTPHLTIGRWRHFERPPRTLGVELLKWRDCEFGESFIDQVVLYESILKPDGASYQKLHIVALS
ncbi:MAG TPA: RNA 2',3'-cyclic phosphodiesterase [Terriglobales bacterium]|nr:RNA 2',3'-cyclic phosphodiesterase [Terriglobales bacterium]